MMLSQIEARLASLQRARVAANALLAVQNDNEGGKTVGVKLTPNVYAMLKEVQRRENLKSMKDAVKFCATLGAKVILGET